MFGLKDVSRRKIPFAALLGVLAVPAVGAVYAAPGKDSKDKAKAEPPVMVKVQAVKPRFTPKAVMPGAKTLGQLQFDCDHITFPDPTPVGGYMHLTIREDGSYTFTGHFRDSGFPSYDVALVYVVKDSQNHVYTFSTKGHMAGTLESGSRNYDWGDNGQNADIAKNWAALAKGSTGNGRARTSLDLGPIVNDIKQAIGAVSKVITVVGSLLPLL
jgi:hypothetical protein